MKLIDKKVLKSCEEIIKDFEGYFSINPLEEKGESGQIMRGLQEIVSYKELSVDNHNFLLNKFRDLVEQNEIALKSKTLSPYERKLTTLVQKDNKTLLNYFENTEVQDYFKRNNPREELFKNISVYHTEVQKRINPFNNTKMVKDAFNSLIYEIRDDFIRNKRKHSKVYYDLDFHRKFQSKRIQELDSKNKYLLKDFPCAEIKRFYEKVFYEINNHENIWRSGETDILMKEIFNVEKELLYSFIRFYFVDKEDNYADMMDYMLGVKYIKIGNKPVKTCTYQVF